MLNNWAEGCRLGTSVFHLLFNPVLVVQYVTQRKILGSKTNSRSKSSQSCHTPCLWLHDDPCANRFESDPLVTAFWVGEVSPVRTTLEALCWSADLADSFCCKRASQFGSHWKREKDIISPKGMLKMLWWGVGSWVVTRATGKHWLLADIQREVAFWNSDLVDNRQDTRPGDWFSNTWPSVRSLLSDQRSRSYRSELLKLGCPSSERQ